MLWKSAAMPRVAAWQRRVLASLAVCCCILAFDTYLLRRADHRVDAWVKDRSRTYDPATATGLRDVDPHVFMVSLDSSQERQRALLASLRAFGVNRERIHIVSAVLGKECRLSRASSPPHKSPYPAPAPFSLYSILVTARAYLGAAGITRPDYCPYRCFCDVYEPSLCRPEPAEVYDCPGDIAVGVTPTFMQRAAALAEFATAASHLKAVRAIYDAGVEWGLVLEDDASLMLVPEWGHFGLREVLVALPAGNWDAVQLYTNLGKAFTMERMKGELAAGRLVSKRLKTGADANSWGAAAYLVSRRGAKRLLRTYWPGVLEKGDMTTEPNGGGSSSDTSSDGSREPPNKTKPLLQLDTATRDRAPQFMDLRLDPIADMIVYSGPGTYIANRPLFAHQLYPLGSSSPGRGSTIHESHRNVHDRSRHRLLTVFYPLGPSYYTQPEWYASWSWLATYLATTIFHFDWDARVQLTPQAAAAAAAEAAAAGGGYDPPLLLYGTVQAESSGVGSGSSAAARWVWPGPSLLRDFIGLFHWIDAALEDFDLYRPQAILRLLAIKYFGIFLPLVFILHAHLPPRRKLKRMRIRGLNCCSGMAKDKKMEV